MFTGLSGERLLLTLWVGSLWAIGYLAVPMAFATLGDIALAGDYAGKLFSAVNLLGLGCASVLIVSKAILFKSQVVRQWRFLLLLAMLLMTLAFSCYLQPQMADIKQLVWQNNAELSARFAQLHAMSKSLYLLLSLCGLALVLSNDKQIELNKVA